MCLYGKMRVDCDERVLLLCVYHISSRSLVGWRADQVRMVQGGCTSTEVVGSGSVFVLWWTMRKGNASGGRCVAPQSLSIVLLGAGERATLGSVDVRATTGKFSSVILGDNGLRLLC
jgi:hypothetical protein